MADATSSSTHRAEPATALQTFVEQHRGDLIEAPMLSSLRNEHRHIASVLALLSDQLNAIERALKSTVWGLHEELVKMGFSGREVPA